MVSGLCKSNIEQGLDGVSTHTWALPGCCSVSSGNQYFLFYEFHAWKHFPEKVVDSSAKATPAEASPWIFISYNQRS